MNLQIILSNTTSCAITNAIASLGKRLAQDSSHIVIAPDRFTLSQEKEIYDTLGLRGSFNIDVLSFSKFAAKLAYSKRRFLTKEGAVMLMKKIMMENMDIFTYYDKLSVSPGFAKQMFAVIASLRTSGITPQMLKKNTEALDARSRCKYADIALIYEKYDQALQSGYDDTISRYKQMIGLLKDSDWVNKSHIYIVGFNIFSELQKNIIQELCLAAKSVTVAIATGGGEEDFFNVRQIEEIACWAGEKGVAVEQRKFFEKLPSPFDYLNRKLFAFGKPALKIKDCDKVYLFTGKNPYEEIRSVAKEIAYLVRDKGLRYKDMALVCCQEDYKNCIKDVFSRCGIPYFIDEKYTAAHSAAAKFLIYVLQAILYNNRLDKVLNVVKHPYMGFSARQIEDFENYCLERNINYDMFLSPFSDIEDSSTEFVRASYADTIDKVVKTGKVSQITDSLLALLANKRLEGDENDMLYGASLQSAERLPDLLDEINYILGESQMSLREYYALLTEGVKSMEFALLPRFLDSVFVGNTSESRFIGLKAMFIVGANEGYFPFKSGEQPILTFADMQNLKQCGLDLRPNPLETNALEKFVAADLICKSQRLYISCSDYDLTGQPMQKGEAIEDISCLLNIKIQEGISHPEFDEKEELIYNLVSAENAFYEYAGGRVKPAYRKCARDFLLDCGYKDRLESLNKQKDDEPYEYKDFYFIKDDQGNYITKVTQLESYFCCPRRHYLQHGLKLKERKTAKLKVVDIGIIIHNFLELFFTKNLSRIRSLTDEEIEEETAAAIEEVLRKENIPSVDAVLNIKKECLYVIKSLLENIKNSCFTPKYIELSFDDNEEGGFGAIKLETKEGLFKIRGKIDRVDVCGDKAAVIDYKTGNAEIEKYKYIFYGKKIQLYTYMSALESKGYKPCGAFYLPIKDGYRKSVDRFRMIGQMEGSEETLRQFDKRLFLPSSYEQDNKKMDSKIIGVSATLKNGKVKYNANQNIIGEEDFYHIMDYVKKVSVKAIEEISRGYSAKAPLKENENIECRYCPYKSLCDIEDITPRKLANVKLEKFKEGKGNG